MRLGSTEKTGHTINQEEAVTIVKRSEWLRLNCQLLVFGSALFLCMTWFIAGIKDDYAVVLILGNLLHPISLWASLMSCWLPLGTITSALSTMFLCQTEIQSMRNGTIDDAIRCYKKLDDLINSGSWFAYAIT